jgi:hypothetical protein
MRIFIDYHPVSAIGTQAEDDVDECVGNEEIGASKFGLRKTQTKGDFSTIY